jgi:uncharacterized membrane protein
MLLPFKLKQSDLADQIQQAGELVDKAYKRMVQINNVFKKAFLTFIAIVLFMKNEKRSSIGKIFILNK